MIGCPPFHSSGSCAAVNNPYFAPAENAVPWTSSSAPSGRPTLTDANVLTDAATALWPNGSLIERSTLAQALAAGWEASVFHSLRVERHLEPALHAPSDVRDAVFLMGERRIREAHVRQEAAWVERQDLKPQCHLGQAVNLMVRGELLRGKVVAVDAVQAHYLVRLTAWCDQVPEELGSLGAWVPYEMVHPLVSDDPEPVLRAD